MNVRNGEAYLKEAIDSVLAQTYADWELIVWDDESTDSSAAIVARYPDPRIRYFFGAKAATLGEAREFAAARATGEWLAFLDQDDIWLPAKLSLQLARAADDPDERVGLVYGRTLACYPDGSRVDFDLPHEYAALPEGDIFPELFRGSCFIAISSAMIRRSAFLRMGGIPPRFGTVSDYFMFTCVCCGSEARAVQDVVALYRIHSDSLSSRSRIRVFEEASALTDYWSARLDPRTARLRRRIFQNGAALCELRRLATMPRGVARLFSSGHPLHLASRPFARAGRAVRRLVRRPYWMSGAGR